MKWDAILTGVLPYAKGCPDDLAIDHIRKAARQFCERTLAWHLTAAPIVAVDGVSKYTLQLPEQSELVKLIACEVDGCPFLVPNWLRGSSMQRRSSGPYAVISGYNDVTISPTPKAGASIVTDVAVKPSMDAYEWDDDLAGFADDVAQGALATLLGMPKEAAAWADAQAASRAFTRFNERCDDLKARVAAGLGGTHHRRTVEWF
jgi:hypothetical protein